MQKHCKLERTLVVIKPDGVQRALVGEIINRYERVGLKLVGIKLMVLTPEFIESHYTLDPEWKMKVGVKSIKGYLDKGQEPPSTEPLEVAEDVLGRIKKYLSAGPVVAMVWQGAHAVQIVRKISGSTEPLMAEIGTIRGDFGLDSYKMTDLDNRGVRNIVHASDSVEGAEKELALWFKSEEIIDYRLISEQILYDVNLDGILE